MPNFNIIEGEPKGFWDDYEKFIKLYNNGKIKVADIKKTLNLTQNKYRQYRSRGLDENRLNTKLRSQKESAKRGGNHRSPHNNLYKVTRKQETILKYLKITFGEELITKNKKEISKIIGSEIIRNPGLDIGKLCLKIKKRCIQEL